MHVGTGLDTHRPEGGGRDRHMHVGAVLDAYSQVKTRTCTWETVRTPTGARGPGDFFFGRGLRT